MCFAVVDGVFGLEIEAVLLDLLEVRRGEGLGLVKGGEGLVVLRQFKPDFPQEIDLVPV